MNEEQLKIKLKKYKDIHDKMQKITSQELDNYLLYIRSKAIQKPSLMPCGGCLANKSIIKQSFRRAFNNFNQNQKIEFYCKTISILQQLTNSSNAIEQQKPTQNKSFNFYDENEKQWAVRQFELNYRTKIIKFRSKGDELDLHNYILRSSKKKDREALALESIEAFQLPPIIRISNYKQSFVELQSQMTQIMDLCLKENLKKMLDKDNKITKTKMVLNQQKIKKQEQIPSNYIIKVGSSKRNQLKQKEQPQINKTPYFKRKETNSKESRSNSRIQNSNLQQIENQQASGNNKFIKKLQDYEGFEKIRNNVYYNSKQNILKKNITIKNDHGLLPIEWICDNLNHCSTFYLWKKTLKSAKYLRNSQTSNFKIFYEQHFYKSNNTVAYIYHRHKIIKNNIYYFIDTPAEHRPQYPKAFGKIEYCIWKIQRRQQHIVIVCEGKINHGENYLSDVNRQFSDAFLGDLALLNSSENLSFQNQPDMMINTMLFEEDYLSQLQNCLNNQQSFYTIANNNNSAILIDIGQVDSKSDLAENKIISPTANFQKTKQSFEKRQKPPYLKFKFSLGPQMKIKPNLVLPKKKGVNPYHQDEWNINEKGEMVSINIEKVKAQAGVLKEIIVSIGRNFLSGKSILNTSLPVTVFGEESNLSLLGKSFGYAPILLQKAAQQTDPVHRLKYVVAFALSSSICYIRMEKPFNPILGQTSHLITDGCQIYGEQISHHPPISSLFMKGRGYSLYGNFESKLSIGLNSAVGSTEGTASISFHPTNYLEDVVKYTYPDGQITGLMYGDRKISAVDKTYYLDTKNYLYVELSFGIQKGVTEYCKYIDGIEGRIVQLPKDVDISNIKKIKKSKKLKEYGLISGRWTKEIYYEDQLVIDYWNVYPHKVQPFNPTFESDAYRRKDLQQRVKNDLKSAQIAKQQLQEIQRNDRKLRAKLNKKSH